MIIGVVTYHGAKRVWCNRYDHGITWGFNIPIIRWGLYFWAEHGVFP